MRQRLYDTLNYFQKIYSKIYSNNLRVLAYHTINDSSEFEKQIKYLKENFNIIDLDILEGHLFKNKKLPSKPLLITFDDGDISVYNNGLSLFTKYNIPSILFVITSLINTTKPFWWDQIRHHIDGEKGESKSWEVKNWSNKQRITYIEKLILESPKAPLNAEQLSSSQLNDLSKSGMEIGNHSSTHPMFDQCETEEIKDELQTSISCLKDLGFHYNVFAYPNGNYDNSSEQELVNSGIKMAFLFDHKINKRKVDPLRISRIRVDSNTNLKEFKVKVSGFHSYIYHNFRKNS
ncbi:polysaccharide deacetylase family protein [uncultured Christiangramia sp.]|uniref:polysaccharide deacetylase family protein n=1 Tax=uncultured Christiangramia sp. TaxID=503836 RepID=UPI002636C421|nr:polysaccharide deacetylase family protein [uncultured Christiangramia sp.]